MPLETVGKPVKPGGFQKNIKFKEVYRYIEIYRIQGNISIGNIYIFVDLSAGANVIESFIWLDISVTYINRLFK